MRAPSKQSKRTLSTNMVMAMAVSLALALPGQRSVTALWNPVSTARQHCVGRAIVALASPRRSKGSGSSKSKAGFKDRQQQQPRRQQRIRVEELEDDDFDDEEDEAGLEALFAQLEKDLEAERAGKKVEVETITEEQMVALEQELMGGGGSRGAKKNAKKKKNKDREEEEKDVSRDEREDEEEEEEQEQEISGGGSGLAKFIEEAQRLESEMVAKRVVKLEKWQLRKLRDALDVEKSQLKVKALAGETGLDRRDVLTFLRDPPPELIELIDSISDKESDEEEDKPEDQTGTQEQDSEAGKEENDSPRVERIGLPGDTQGTGPKAWYGKKRIRKEHLETFEKVFQRTKRPTGALIQNIVELTHVPRKRVLDWFENRRQEHAARKEENRHLARK
ncbi:protein OVEREXPRESSOR OF CATIONIC PEROXIDASE 3-like [Selaginella moellendorffii]|uniref:protein OVEREXPRESSOR OF CATIONIC PEROXIDASE 3-like n=1 Tax=Selaginella moellendorffii TaxID=88036 RepID=UPI000D1C7EB0|nr:protein OVEREXPRESSOR OF CATIONIC PEROXIDASE 3-like [Selaginella moellendorffii]|eukprot:XP_024540144.1 protein OVEREXPRESSOR OF CATIONIC PEROXIDASE 3-like [Selaginella moellendorffii]